MSAANLWAEVESRYDATTLIELTNVRNPAADEINVTAGQSAAAAVLGLWPTHAQIDYDETDDVHVEAAVMGVIAVLWRRGGSSAEAQQVKWDEVFGSSGVVTMVKRVKARGRVNPESDSTLTERRRSWSDSLPSGVLPSPYTPDDEV